ncbi:ComF family protein [bacterium]|nr:ComF family protein [bacterium]
MQLSTRTVRNPIKLLLTGIIDLIYPPLCLNCEQRLNDNEDQLCDTCLDGFKLLGKVHDDFSVPGKIYINSAWALFDFDKAFQNLIHHLKYSRRRKPVQVVLNHYKKQILTQLPQNSIDYVISIPLHLRKLRERGYNQVDDMSHWLAKHLESEIGNHFVERTKYTQSQTQLNAAERQQNVTSAFAVKSDSEIMGKHILLVDDVLTTGATANALAQVLDAAGAARIDLITLSTPQKGST